jgi:starvation-inducible DNA-binding protein
MSSATTATRHFSTYVGLPAETREQVIEMLNQHLADTFDLMSQVKQAHLNVKGKDFNQFHLLFDEIAGEVVEFVDLMAERVTSLGGYATGTVRMAAENSAPPEYPTDITDGLDHVKALVERYGVAISFLGLALPASAGAEDSPPGIKVNYRCPGAMEGFDPGSFTDADIEEGLLLKRTSRRAQPGVETLEGIAPPTGGITAAGIGPAHAIVDVKKAAPKVKVANPATWATLAGLLERDLAVIVNDSEEARIPNSMKAYTIKLIEVAARDAGVPPTPHFSRFFIYQKFADLASTTVTVTGLLQVGKNAGHLASYPLKLVVVNGQRPQLAIWPAGTNILVTGPPMTE